MERMLEKSGIIGVDNMTEYCMESQEGKEAAMINWSLYVITGGNSRNRLITESVKAAIAGGATIIQLREKKMPPDEIIPLGRKIHLITKAAGVPLIINDYPEVAVAIGAEGVHVGQEDMNPQIAREIIGPDKILGVSASNVDEAQKAALFANYIGAGPVFPTVSKADAEEPIGLNGLSKIIDSVDLPVVAIGGINHSNASQVIQAGAAGIAVISAVMDAAEPQRAAEELFSIIQEAQNIA